MSLTLAFARCLEGGGWCALHTRLGIRSHCRPVYVGPMGWDVSLDMCSASLVGMPAAREGYMSREKQ